MKKLLMAVVILLMASESFAFNLNSVNLSPNLSSNIPNNSGSQLNVASVAQIEQNLFGRIYSSQDMPRRLDRIERRLFSRSFANMTDSQRLDNIISNYNKMNIAPNISLNSLSRIERMLYSQDYSQNSVQNRIERLEQQLFGAVQSGNLEARAKAIEIAGRNYNRRLNPYGSTRTGGLLSGLAGLLGQGVVTGMTPPINNSMYPDYYNQPQFKDHFSDFNNPNYGNGFYRGVQTPWGYHDHFSNFGSGSRVTILD